MAKIKVTCDSTCDLTKELFDKYNIDMIPLGISMGDDFRYDNVNVAVQELYDYAEKTGELPKTSAISIGEYLERFQKYVDQGFQVIHISLSSRLSSSYQNACIAARQIGNVFVVDSQNLSTGSGHMVMRAADLAAAGVSAGEIVQALEEMRSRIEVSFVLQTLDYLYKGGRCSALAVFGANMLKIRPEIVVSSGSMGLGKKYRGNIEKSILSYVRGRLEGRTDLDTSRIFITHSGVPENIISAVKMLVLQLHPFTQVIETQAGSTISSHCGPNCLGLALLRK